MELRFVPPDLRRLDEIGTEIICCGFFSDERPPHGTLGLLDFRLAGWLSRLIQSGRLSGARGELSMISLRPKLPFDKALVFGLGERESFDERAYRETMERMLDALEGLCARAAVIELPGRHVGALSAEQAADIALELAAERPEQHDAFTLIERPEDEKRIVLRMIEQRRRVRRLISEEIPPSS